MFQPREIVYGYAKGFYSPHNKYIVTIYKDENLSIVACFTTSKDRSGVDEAKIHHGAIYENGQCLSYIFEKDVIIGTDPEKGEGFAFPKRSVVVFDYGVLEGSLASFLGQFDNPKVVCVLSEKEYIDLVYAMYSSPHTKQSHKAVLDKILAEHYNK